MEVAHTEDLDTHAVIGGQQIKAFGIAQTAEFFTVLSSTLYSNKPLAVIREVLCNAWDSHIASNVTNVPVDITLTYEELIIRDYGKGIPPDLMHEIYCVYGSSTKKNDGRQTGGFGLGSKAPFAYSDFFTVTDHYEGKKTVYAISRGSQITQGVPDMRVVVGNLPTTEQGVEVKIPLKSESDFPIFKNIINNITYYGEMNVRLNGKHLEILPISKLAINNIFITKPINNDNKKDRIYIRYGNVLYPVDFHTEYAGEYSQISKNLDHIPSNRMYTKGVSDWQIIIQAQPNTISVTPSRESLSMTETTINTIKNLFQDILEHFSINSENFINKIKSLEQQALDNLWMAGRPDKILSRNKHYTDNSNRDPNYFVSMDQIAQYMISGDYYPSQYQSMFDNLHIESLIKGRFRRWKIIEQIDTKLIKKGRIFSNGGTRDSREKFQKIFFHNILKKLYKEGLNPKNLLLVTNGHDKSSIRGKNFYQVLNPYPTADFIRKLLISKVIFSPNRTAFSEGYATHANEWDSGYCDLVYIVPKKIEDREKAKAIFESFGFYIDDFYTKWEKQEPINKPKTIPAEPREEGLPSLLNNLTPDKQVFNMRGYRNINHMRDKLIRVKNPEWIFQAVSLNGYDARFFEFGDRAGKEICELFGERSGVAASVIQFQKYLEKGSKNGLIELVNTVCDYILNSQSITEYRSFFANSNDHIEKLIKISKYSNLIKNKIHVPNPLTLEEQKYLKIFQSLTEKVTYGWFTHAAKAKPDGWEAKIVETHKKYEEIKPSPHYTTLIQKLEERKKYVECVNLYEIEHKLRYEDVGRDFLIHQEINIIRALDL